MTMPPVPAAQLDLLTGANRLLSVLEAQLQVQGVELPGRVGLIPGGLVAYDADMLTVNLTGLTRGKPSAPITTPGHPSQITQFLEYEVNLLRQVTVVNAGGKPPAQSKLAADFTTIANDAAALWAAIVTIHANYLIVPDNVPFVYGPLITVGPEGGIAGVRCPVAWQTTRAKTTAG